MYMYIETYCPVKRVRRGVGGETEVSEEFAFPTISASSVDTGCRPYRARTSSRVNHYLRTHRSRSLTLWKSFSMLYSFSSAHCLVEILL